MWNIFSFIVFTAIRCPVLVSAHRSMIIRPLSTGPTSQHNELSNILQNIANGYRILLLMRGAPGSGKSHLARSIIDESRIGNYEDHIFSTDDFFYNVHQKRYTYDRALLDVAHKTNQSKVQQRMLAGWSPIIVDNTNIKLWEMLPYARAAVHNGYLISILEANSPWARSADELATRNKHGVPREQIVNMLKKYEEISVDEFLKRNQLVHNLRGPVLRKLPPIKLHKW